MREAVDADSTRQLATGTMLVCQIRLQQKCSRYQLCPDLGTVITSQPKHEKLGNSADDPVMHIMQVMQIMTIQEKVMQIVAYAQQGLGIWCHVMHGNSDPQQQMDQHGG